MAWYAWDNQPQAFFGHKLLDELGVDAYVSLPGVWRAENAAYGNLRHGPENVSRVIPTNTDDSLVREPCLTDPEFRARTAERIEQLARDVQPFGVLEWSMGDESSMGNRDYCISPTCLAAFREYLQEQYGTLEALNASWDSAFNTWDEVVPATRTEVEGKSALGPWLDHRRYMESLFAEYHDWCRELVLRHIPEARVGISGTPGLNSYSGHDWWKLMQGPLDHLSGYGGIQRELQRSFARPDTFVSTFLGYDYKDNDEQRARYAPWDLLFHGSNGVNYYTLMSNTLNCPLIRPDMTLTNKAPWYFEEVRQLKDGFGRLFMSGEYAHDGIAIHYSPASIHTATATGLFDPRDRLRNFNINISNIGRILQHMHYQYDFIHEEQMARGELERYRVLFLPWSSALSPREAEAIRRFVNGGGIVIADSYCGVRDDHGKVQPMLDDLFGIRQSAAVPELVVKELQLIDAENAPWGPDPLMVASGDPDLQVAGGEAVALIGDMPALIVNQVGEGVTLFINGSFSNYAEVWEAGEAGETLDEEQAPETVQVPIRQILRQFLTDAQVRPSVQVETDDNQSPQIETSRLRLGEASIYGVVRGITAGAVDYDETLDFTLKLPDPAHVYESRSGRYLGHVDTITDSLSRGISRVFAALPYELQQVTLAGGPTVTAGQPLALTVTVTPAGGARPVPHVVHITLTGPDGEKRRWYAHNVLLEEGTAQVTVPLAHSDLPGAWTVEATDIMTGLKANLNVTVTGG